MRCVVSTCKNSSQLTPDITFFKFPTNPSLRATWLGALQEYCKLEEDSAVCSEHFLMNDLLKTSGRCQLRAGAVPVLKNVLEDHLTEPSDVKVCRVCLKTEGEMYKMEENSTLCEVYQILTGLMLSDEVRLPRSVCPKCSSWMLECDRFKSTSLRSHLVLQQILNRHGCITVESVQSINKFHSPVSLDTTDKQTDQCHSHNEAVIKHEDAQTDKQADTVRSSHVDKDIIIDVIKEESDDSNIMNVDIVKIEYDNDDTDKVTDDNDITENSVVDNVLDLQETAADLVKVEIECLNEDDVNKQSDNDEMEHGTGFSDEDLSLRELSQTKTRREQGIHGFSQRVHLAKHLKKHSGERIYTCEVCQKTFPYKISLTKHLRIHSGERPYTCDICGKSFSQKNVLTNHMRAHSGERPYACNICQKKFSQKVNLTIHFKTHSGDRPYACDICHKTFSHTQSLTRHSKIHSGERPYTCDICHKSFSHTQSLTRHSKTHSGERPYTCNICQKRFSRKTHLTRHSRTHNAER